MRHLGNGSVGWVVMTAGVLMLFSSRFAPASGAAFAVATGGNGNDEEVAAGAGADSPAQIIITREALNRHRQQHHINTGPGSSSRSGLIPPRKLDEDENQQVRSAQAPASMFMEQQQQSRAERERSLWSEDFEKRASELCGTSASLECGRRILNLIEGQEMSELSVHMKCDLRDDFLKCIDTQKQVCLELATKSMLPELPPKDMIKMERSKLWKVLWTAGGCVLAD